MPIPASSKSIGTAPHSGSGVLSDDARRRDWRRHVALLLESHPTPFFLFSAEPITSALRELDATFSALPVTQWLSVKTQPLPAMVRWWNSQKRPVEVVSRLEYELASQAGVPAARLLVNGPAKQAWLRSVSRTGIRVNFDSVAEVRALASIAKREKWVVGLRCNTASEFDPESPKHPTQFGMSEAELTTAVLLLRKTGIEPHVLHFHLRTNVARHEVYRTAISEAFRMAAKARFHPSVLDIGGGFPAPHVKGMRGWNVDQHFSLQEMKHALARTIQDHASVKEIWLENGRWLSARSGVLVTRILDIKERRGMRSLICDGGRTLHAMPSCWEQHDMTSLPRRVGPSILSTVNGPTCMAFDKLFRGMLPNSLRVGDALIWLDAGAYHLSWETRFSHGAAAVFWKEGKLTRCVRDPEDFQTWNQQWK